MPEWSNGARLGRAGSVPTEVRILFSAFFQARTFLRADKGDKKDRFLEVSYDAVR